MDENRLLEEAQLIASKFQFWMREGKLDHLFGYIYESKDGETKYSMDIIYDETFPDNPPQFEFNEEIPNLSGEIELETLTNWTPNSNVVDILIELNQMITRAIEGESAIKENAPLQNIPGVPTKPQSGAQPESNESVVSSSNTNTQPISSETTGPMVSSESSTSSESSESSSSSETSESSESSEQYLTPNLDAYPTDDNYQYDANANQMPEWSAQDFEQQNQNTYTPQENNTDSSPNQEYSYSEEEADLTISTEAALIQQEYAMDYIEGSIGKVEIYLTITIEQTFIIKIDFTEYPRKPKIEMPEGVNKLLGDINDTIDILKNWNEDQPSHVVEIIREIESKLWFLSDIEGEAKKIMGEYKTKLIHGIITNLKVSFFTYGFKEYTLEIDISKLPAPPNIKMSEELETLIKIPIDNIKAYSGWKRKESQAVDILREIQWLIDKNSRINFELKLLEGGIKNVTYNKEENSIQAKLAGEMKTKDLSFEFEAKLPNAYPMEAPKIVLKSDLENQEDIKTKLEAKIKTFTSSWNPFSYLIDLFNDISKAIFEVSVISCVICHSIDCPTCKLKISAPNKEEQCQIECPHCERLYHKHCWDQTIISFGKCGFCLRTPPPDMIPQM